MPNNQEVKLRGLTFKDEKLIFDWKSNEQLRELLGTTINIFSEYHT